MWAWTGGSGKAPIAILPEDGELVNRRIRPQRSRLIELLGQRPPAKILLEASLPGEGVVARGREDLGPEVIGADPH
jgi:hypothetical protein